MRTLLVILTVSLVSCGDDDVPRDGSVDTGTDAATDSASDTSGDVGMTDAGPDVSGDFAINGRVETPSGSAISDARVTLVAGGVFVDEVRSDAEGSFTFAGLAEGSFDVGASVLRREYVEESVNVDGDVMVTLVLGAETHPGRWSVIGDTEPERPAGTPSATLMPDGNILFCHDTQEGVIFDPSTGAKSMAAMSPSSQGCHMATTLSDGQLIFVGGQAREDPGAFTEAVRTVKLYDPVADTWQVLEDMNEERWYPSLIRLPDERLMACGGGQRPDARRTATCELFDPDTRQWTRTGSLSQPTEYSPSALLLTGDILTTWSPPQLYDIETGAWRATGELVQGDRGFPDHSDHSLVVTEDGSAIAIGYEGDAGSAMVEIYDPGAGTWSLGASPDVIRSQAEIVMLPDGRVLAAGGTLEQGSAPTNAFGDVATTDLYDPSEDSWRNVAPMAMPREYHAMTLLVPDGRVVTTSGTGDQACCPAPEASVEAFEPPYLFRGLRPTMTTPPPSSLRRGESLSLRFSNTRAPTSVVLIGTGAVTHWMDGGVPRIIRLAPTVDGDTATVELPNDPVAAPVGHYILYLMVDDIPSEGAIVHLGNP